MARKKPVSGSKLIDNVSIVSILIDSTQKILIAEMEIKHGNSVIAKFSSSLNYQENETDINKLFSEIEKEL